MLNRGFLRFIIALIIFIIVLSLLGINVRGVFEHPLVQENLSFLTDGLKFLWGLFVEGIQNLKEGNFVNPS